MDAFSFLAFKETLETFTNIYLYNKHKEEYNDELTPLEASMAAGITIGMGTGILGAYRAHKNPVLNKSPGRAFLKCICIGGFLGLTWPIALPAMGFYYLIKKNK